MNRSAIENQIADTLCRLGNAEISAVFAFADARKNGATLTEACNRMNTVLSSSDLEPIPTAYIESILG